MTGRIDRAPGVALLGTAGTIVVGNLQSRAVRRAQLAPPIGYANGVPTLPRQRRRGGPR